VRQRNPLSLLQEAYSSWNKKGSRIQTTPYVWKPKCSSVHSSAPFKHAASLAKRSTVDKNVGWSEDSLYGPDHPANSETMLLDWLTTGDNYTIYRGGFGGRTKLHIANTIAFDINEKGIKKERTGDMIIKKIGKFENLTESPLTGPIVPVKV
jgi:hypothetical protein